jgi:hypothetical protein
MAQRDWQKESRAAGFYLLADKSEAEKQTKKSSVDSAIPQG